MILNLVTAVAILTAPVVGVATSEVTSEPTSVEAETTEVVSEETTSEDIAIADDIVEDEDFDFGEWFNEKFSGQTLALLGTIIGLIASLLKLESMAREKVTHATYSLKNIDNHTNATVKTSVDEQIATKIVPLIEENQKLNQSLLESTELLCKLIVAREDQTASGKEYFANLTQSMGSIFKDSKVFATKVSANLKTIVESTKEAKEDITNKLQDIVDDVDLPVE